MPKQTPLIRKTPLTNRWVCITKYKPLKGSTLPGAIEATEKFDVHDQIEQIIKESNQPATPEPEPLEFKRITVRVEARKRDVMIYLSLVGYVTVLEAKPAIIAKLKENDVEGDVGRVESVDADPDAIEVMTDTCGFTISHDDIAKAIKANGKEVSCS